MTNSRIDRILNEIWKRRFPEGGFASLPGGQYRPDATAWAALALRMGGIEPERLDASMQRLNASQTEDGRVVLSADQPEAFWPTPLAMLAWHKAPGFVQCQSRAAAFLLKTTGNHFKRSPGSPAGHDTNIKGWPWIEGTHSWVEPTSLAMIALRVTGNEGSDRVEEGSRLLRDRQLSRGGWNYGNTTVFGTELGMMPESTGLALSALPGLTARQDVSRSIVMLKESVRTLKTPLSLGWAVLGLAAWGERPGDANDLIDRCLGRQDRYGAYDTPLVGLLAVARKAEGGLIHALS